MMPLFTEWIQGDSYKTLLFSEQVHVWPDGEAESYSLSDAPDAAAVLNILAG